MFFSAEDDDQDFLSPGGSKLGALFGMDKASNTGGNESLTYTAPKQPRRKESTPPSQGSAPGILFAVAVQTYKYVDNQYANQGKLGSAILANHAASDYKILLYVNKQQQVTMAKITPTFTFTVQANNYASFYDDARHSWSLMFDTEQNATQFAKSVGLAKALSHGGNLTALVSQDLVLGDGGTLEAGDSAEMKYTGWLLTNNTFGQVFDSNASADKLFRFKLGAGKVIKGWDQGVIGMKKGGKRLLVVPPGLAYGSQGAGNKVPANATLIFEVEVVRVKIAKGDAGTEVTPAVPVPSAPSPAPSSGSIVEDGDLDEATVKGRTKSISEQMSHSPESSGKARLISRMAKMGKPMLPMSGAVAAGPDSEEEPVPDSPKPMSDHPAERKAVPRPVAKPHPETVAPPTVQAQPITGQYYAPQPVISQAPTQTQPAFVQNLPAAQQMAVFQPQPSLLQQQQQALLQQQLQQSQMYGGGIQAPQQPAVPGTSYPPYTIPGMQGQGQGSDMMLLSETRQQTTEVRLTLGKVSDKVDQVLQKVELLQSQSAPGTSMLPNMETSVVLHNIQRIVQENDRLKKDVFEKSGKIETQNEKISELLQRNQSYVEQSQTLMEERNAGMASSSAHSQSKLLALEQEKVKMATELSTAMSQISSLQMEISAMKKKELELQTQLGSSSQDSRHQTEELETLRTQHTEDESRIVVLTRQCREEKQARKTTENNMSQFQEEMADLKSAKEMLEKTLSDRKRKAAEEKRQLEDELEDVKANLEAEIQSLKEKLRRQKSSTNAATAEQMSQIEEEINRDWKTKSEKMLAAATEKHARAMEESREEKEELEKTVQELEQKIQNMRRNSSSSEQRVTELQEEVEELQGWKEKYEGLRGQATTMKQRYEDRIQEVEEERDRAEEKAESLGEEVPQLREEVRQLKASGTTGAAPSPGPSSVNLLDEIKKIMNKVYRDLREEFEADESYTGAQVLAAILNAIKVTTLSLMQKPQEQPADQVSDSEEEEEDDEDEEEEEAVEEEEEEEEEAKEDEKKEKTEEGGVMEKKAEEEEEESEEEEEPEVKTEEEEREEAAVVKEAVSEVKEAVSEVKKAVSETKEEMKEEEEEVKEPEVKVTGAGDTVNNVDSPVTESARPYNTNTGESGGASEVSTPLTSGEADTDMTTGRTVQRSVSTDSLEAALDSALKTDPSKSTINQPESAAPPESAAMVTLVSTEPPPLSGGSSDSEEDKEDHQLFGNDDHVAETLGIAATKETEPPKKTADRLISNDEDLKPKPPSLFPDDDDEDDLDWLS